MRLSAGNSIKDRGGGGESNQQPKRKEEKGMAADFYRSSQKYQFSKDDLD